MFLKRRTTFAIGLLVGVVLAIGGVVWWMQGPTDQRVRRTVITTVQEEAPASFFVTGTLTIRATVAIDSAQYATPGWLNTVLNYSHPTLLPMLRGSSTTTVQVPRRVSYGFDVRKLTPEHIRVEDDGAIAVNLPELSVHSVEPDLARLRVKSSTEGWMRVFPSDVHEEVRKEALAGVKGAFQTQAERHLDSATQPRVNTARALKALLMPSLKAAGVDEPRFRMWVGERLTLSPEGDSG